MKSVTLINYTGSKGGGAQYAFELTQALCQQGLPLVAVISEHNEHLTEWRSLPIEKLIVIPTYQSVVQLIGRSLFWQDQKNRILEGLKDYQIQQIISPMITFWTRRINRLYPQADSIVVLHDPIAHSGDRNKRALQLFGESQLLKEAQEIVVLSDVFVSYVEDCYGKKGRVSKIPMGTTQVYGQLRDKIQAVEYAPDKVNFLFFGTISKYKGIEVLLQAYQKISQAVTNTTLTIAGSGDFSAYRHLLANQPSVQVINRWIANEEVESFFADDSVVVVLPYLDATQSGVIPIAIEYERPLIISDTGGLVEQAQSYNTGLLVKAGDVDALAQQMLEIANNEDLRHALKEQARANKNQNTWSAVAQSFLKLLKEEKS